MKKLRGIGPKSLILFKKVGIDSHEKFMKIDPFELYKLLKQIEPKVSLNMIYGIIAAQEDIDWREVARNQKTQILMRLDDMGLAPK